MDDLYLARGQLVVGFVLACALTLLLDYAVYLYRRDPENQTFEKAELRSGGWQYYDTYFDTIERFRNDFA